MFYTMMLCLNLSAQFIQYHVLLSSYKLQFLHYFFYDDIIYILLLNFFYNYFVLSKSDFFKLRLSSEDSVCSFQSLNAQTWIKVYSPFSSEVVDRADCIIHYIWRWRGSEIKLRSAGWCRNKRIRDSII